MEATYNKRPGASSALTTSPQLSNGIDGCNITNPLCPGDIVDRARLIRADFDRLPWLDGDLDTEGSYRLIDRIGKYVNDGMAMLSLRYRRAA